MINRDTYKPCSMALLIAVAFQAAPAYAQFALGDGRALDRNLQVGSGGINPTVGDSNYAARNNLITGNVTGLGYFHDDVGYTSPHEFRDVTSGSDLFRFHAISGPSGVGDPDDNVRPFYQRQAIYRSFVGPAAGQGGLPGDPGQPLTTGKQGGYRIFDYSRLARIGITGIDPRMRSTLQTTTLPDGQILETTASPLLGIQRNLFDPRKALGLTEYIPGSLPQKATDASGADPRITPERISTKIGLESGQWTDIGLRTHSALELGRQLNPHLALLTTAQRPQSSKSGEIPNASERLGQIQANILNPVPTHGYRPGNDVYMDLLKQIEQRGMAAQNGATSEAKRANGDAPDPLTKLTRLADPTTAAGGLPIFLEPPTPQQLEDAQTMRDKALYDAVGWTLAIDSSRNLAGQDKQKLKTILDRGPEGFEDPLARIIANDPIAAAKLKTQVDDEQGEEDKQRQVALDRLMNVLDYDMPGVKTFAGNGKTRINELLRSAEQHLAMGRHFDAEEDYQFVLIGMPGHPMARVGVIHSQLGAGMLRSASVNLRGLFERHPEMIATRYDAKTLPTADRLVWARQQIEKMIRKSEHDDPALLLAYLGYQTHQDELVTYGLDLAQARNPLDPLNVLLRRIWLESKSKAQEPREPAEPSAAPPTPDSSAAKDTAHESDQ